MCCGVAPARVIEGRRARVAGNMASITARGNLRWPPRVVIDISRPLSAQRRKVLLAIPSRSLAWLSVSHSP